VAGFTFTSTLNGEGAGCLLPAWAGEDLIELVQLILKFAHLGWFSSKLILRVDLLYLAFLLLASQHFSGRFKAREHFFSSLLIGRVLRVPSSGFRPFNLVCEPFLLVLRLLASGASLVKTLRSAIHQQGLSLQTIITIWTLCMVIAVACRSCLSWRISVSMVCVICESGEAV
jgi:hypothetical protein